MRKTIFAIVLGAAAALAFAQQEQKPQPQANEQLDKDAQDRVRAERAAGGARQITPEEHAGAEAGAGPHKQFKPSGAAKRKHVEDAPERQAGRGATR
jgi:hypothetical protein